MTRNAWPSVLVPRSVTWAIPSWPICDAGIAAVDDASAVYYNPAGLANQPACWRRPRLSPDLLPAELRAGDDDKTPTTPRTEREEAERQRVIISDAPPCFQRDRGDLLVG